VHGEDLCDREKLLLSLAGFENLSHQQPPIPCVSLSTPLGTFSIPQIDPSQAEKECLRLEKEIELLRRNVTANESKLADEKFRCHAPQHIIAGAEKLLCENRKQLQKKLAILDMLKKSSSE
jgi:valyl-tRNA synthetase